MDLDDALDRLRKGDRLNEAEVEDICLALQDILYQEPTILSLQLPIVVCGDIHGQLGDLIRLFEVGGDVRTTQYLFLGDYVDRGVFSLETFLYLAILKLKYPRRMFLLRGNHECRSINQLYGFYEQIMAMYGHAYVWQTCNELFDILPIGALIGRRIFCVHGGLSPDIRAIEQFHTIDRGRELPNAGPLADATWSDPDEGIMTWAPNQRGAGWIFGARPTREFLQLNEISLVARAHQIAMSGYQYSFADEILVTVWSAPNYMARSNNKASVMKVIADGRREFVVFDAVANPAPVPDSVPARYFE